MRSPTVFALTLVAGALASTSTAAAESDLAAHGGAGNAVEVPEGIRAVAPSGSCVMSPDAARCPPVDEIVSSELALSDGSTAYAPLEVANEGAAKSSVRSRRKATAAQAVGHACAVQSWDPVKLFHPGGDAFIRASGANECRSGVGVSYQELYVSLERYVDDRWQRLATNRAVRHGPGRISEIAGFNCHHHRLIPYRTEAFAYAVVNQVGYTGTDRAYQNHTCWP